MFHFHFYLCWMILISLLAKHTNGVGGRFTLSLHLFLQLFEFCCASEENFTPRQMWFNGWQRATFEWNHMSENISMNNAIVSKLQKLPEIFSPVKTIHSIELYLIDSSNARVFFSLIFTILINIRYSEIFSIQITFINPQLYSCYQS